MSYEDIVPYTSVFIDATLRDFLKSAYWCIKSPNSRDELVRDIEQLFKNRSNSNSVLPCLSVRSCLDLFLSVFPFPPGSEIIMSAVNIPNMVEVVHFHGLEIVSLDIDVQSMKPKVELLESLITSKTKFILVANIYGRGFDVSPFIEIAKKNNIMLIEDWAEGFSGLDYLGHPESDLSLFSFGSIKYYTAYGGAIAKVKDINIYHRMKNLYDTYPMQTHYDYLTKTMKVTLAYLLLNCPRLIKPMIYMTRRLGIEHKEKVIGLLRGFPKEMMKKIRHQPCSALLATLGMRLAGFDRESFFQSNVKAEYALARLPFGAGGVGLSADTRNHWLFPVLVENPEEVIKCLNNLGVDAYCGATQLGLVKCDRPLSNNDRPVTAGSERSKSNDSSARNEYYLLNNKSTPINDKSSKSQVLNPKDHPIDISPPQHFGSKMEAEYLMSHVIYLPINKTIPFEEIDKICRALAKALKVDDFETAFVPPATEDSEFKTFTKSYQTAIKSKL